MPDKLLPLLLRLYPKDSRDQLRPHLEADLFHPNANRPLALFRILRGALLMRLQSPQPYIWIGAWLLAAVAILLVVPLTLHRLLPQFRPNLESDTGMYALMFLAVFLVLSGTLLAAVLWHNTAGRMLAKRPLAKYRA